MKKITLTLIALLGFTGAMVAQETETVTTTTTTTKYVKPDSKDRFNFYYGFGVNVLGDYKMNDKLKASGMPTIASAAPEFTFGANYTPSDTRFYHDLELAVAYMDDKTETNRLRTSVVSFKIRVHYKAIETENLFLSGGLDLGVATTLVNLYSRGNTIDLDDLNPATHTGHINMYSTQFSAGPSLALGLFQKKAFPVRINTGYNIGFTRGKWKSDFANVANTVSESGLGSFYAKVSIGF